MRSKTLQDLYVDELKDFYSAESQLIHALPKMAKAARSPELREAFSSHLQQTEEQVERIEQIFSTLGSSAKGKNVLGRKGRLMRARK